MGKILHRPVQARLDDQRRAMEAEVDAELAAERERAAAARAAKEKAIAAKQQELRQLEDDRRLQARRLLPLQAVPAYVV